MIVLLRRGLPYEIALQGGSLESESFSIRSESFSICTSKGRAPASELVLLRGGLPKGEASSPKLCIEVQTSKIRSGSQNPRPVGS